MQVKLLPPLRSEWEMAAMEESYLSRLTELFGSSANARQSHDEWHKLHHPVIHHWTTYNMIAMQETTKELLPSERKLMIARVDFK